MCHIISWNAGKRIKLLSELFTKQKIDTIFFTFFAPQSLFGTLGYCAQWGYGYQSWKFSYYSFYARVSFIP